jgi:hypothetical protein
MEPKRTKAEWARKRAEMYAVAKWVETHQKDAYDYIRTQIAEILANDVKQKFLKNDTP